MYSDIVICAWEQFTNESGGCLHCDEDFICALRIDLLHVSKGTETNWTFHLAQSNKKLIQNFLRNAFGGD
jgi:hypothetical protein